MAYWAWLASVIQNYKRINDYKKWKAKDSSSSYSSIIVLAYIIVSSVGLSSWPGLMSAYVRGTDLSFRFAKCHVTYADKIMTDDTIQCN